MLLQRCGIEKRNINQAISEYDKCLALDKEKGRFEYHSTLPYQEKCEPQSRWYVQDLEYSFIRIYNLSFFFSSQVPPSGVGAVFKSGIFERI